MLMEQSFLSSLLCLQSLLTAIRVHGNALNYDKLVNWLLFILLLVVGLRRRR